VLGEQLPDDVSQKLALVASELVTNCVRHSSAGQDSRIELDAIVENDVVRLSIQDHGHGFEAPDPTRTAGSTGGWGLQVVDRLVERWWIETDAGTRVICELRRA
jgi:signal transduction histidine kinase